MSELLQILSNQYTDSNRMFEEFSKAIGFADGQIDAAGILAGGTTNDITNALNLVITQNRPIGSPKVVNRWVSDKINQLTRKYIHEIQATTEDLPELLTRIKSTGIIIGIATADDYNTTMTCLEALGIRDMFEFIVTSDRYPAQKPDPGIVLDFCKKYRIKTNQVAVIGDTLVDLTLAENANAGLSIGVLSGTSTYKDLVEKADIIVPTIGNIIDENNHFIWEKA
ncbi:phosphoglycolate phosphatase [Gracilibacillus ureilyticus]|uniref:Phosphoglycolate phosphatase n=2 Tax=Gracilibacillus ureilyticus TaxID=531814 RepID=A0A1H9UL93_9BACI|nr:phosphoglycolate phosphatase [Gracilibacillus ureilyticus]